MGVTLVDWKFGLKVEMVEAGSLSEREEYFNQGDGILEIDSISLNSGSYRNTGITNNDSQCLTMTHIVTMVVNLDEK